MNDIRRYMNMLTENTQLNEYGTVDWNWFTNDKRIFIASWMSQGDFKQDAIEWIRDIEKDSGQPFEDFWHPMDDFVPATNDATILKQEIEALEIAGDTGYDSGIDDEDYGDYDDYDEGRSGEYDLIVMTGAGNPTRYRETGLDGAFVSGNLAVWKGDDTTWL